jgi:hypothetical protein
MARSQSWAKDRERTQMRNSEALYPKGQLEGALPLSKHPAPPNPDWMENRKLLPKKPPPRRTSE